MQMEKTKVRVYRIPDGQNQPNPPFDEYLGEGEVIDGDFSFIVVLPPGIHRIYSLARDRVGNLGGASELRSVESGAG